MVFNFNTSFVFHTKVDQHKQFKKEIKDLFKTTTKKEQNDFFVNMYTSSFFAGEPKKDSNNKLDQAFLNIFERIETQAIMPAFNQMKNEVKLNYGKSFAIRKMWVNLYEPTGILGPHVHQRCDFTGIYLVDLFGQPNNTIFFTFSQNPAVMREYVSDDIEEGSIILFPSQLPHDVLPCKNKKLCIAFDIEVLYEENGYYGESKQIFGANE
jgi:hypothetical protein